MKAEAKVGASGSVRISVALYERLKALADENDRTIAAELRRAILAHLDANGRG